MTAGLTLDVVTIFPDYLAPLHQSLVGKAIARGAVALRVHDLRRWTDDAHRTVDDAPYGGGPGMVMRPEPWGRALDAITGGSADGRADDNAGDAQPLPRLIVPTPTGRPFTQALAAELAAERWLVFACGRYEGIDARVVDYAAQRMPVTELSIGDYVLAGGEAAVLVVVEAVCRLLPGVLGNERSAVEDSFAAGVKGLLEAPAYTRPAMWRGLGVPDVLLSGDHAAVERWRAEQGRARTQQLRPDLLPADVPPAPA